MRIMRLATLSIAHDNTAEIVIVISLACILLAPPKLTFAANAKGCKGLIAAIRGTCHRSPILLLNS